MTENKEVKIVLYQLKPFEQQIQFKPIGYILENEQVKDEPLPVETINNKESNSIYLFEDIHAVFFKNNVPITYIIATKKLPVIYTTINYYKRFITGSLFTLALMFEITEDTKQFKTVRHLLGSKVYGKYYYELKIENEDKEKCKTITFELDKFKSIKDCIETMKTMVKSDMVKEIAKEQMKERDAERAKKLGNIELYTIPDESKIKNFNDLINKKI